MSADAERIKSKIAEQKSQANKVGRQQGLSKKRLAEIESASMNEDDAEISAMASIKASPESVGGAIGSASADEKAKMIQAMTPQQKADFLRMLQGE